MQILDELPPSAKIVPVPVRLWSKVNKRGPRPSVNPKLGPCWLWTGSVSTGGYGQIAIDRRPKLAHRIAYELMVGPIPEGAEIDHRCLVKLCVNPKHLRPVTRAQNAQNLLPQHGTKSGVRGVSWDCHRNKWTAQVTAHGVKYRLGRFNSIEDASEAVRKKRLEVFTHSEIDQK